MRRTSNLALVRPRHRSRAGVALVMFAMLVFVFLAVAGLAIDVGMANLTQQQMQAAVDTASLEGVRLRDFDEYQSHSDAGRRPKVSQLVRYCFDDDMHPTQGGSGYYSVVPAMMRDDEDTMRMGAGPMMQVSGGTGPMAASGTMTVPASPVWDDPVLQTNVADNRARGDMVSGLYVPDAAHVENPDYTRPDFTNGTGLARWRSLAFLVRMRRTNDPADDQAGVSTRAPALSFLFGLGSLMQQGPTGWDPRRSGLTVRATAIAVARPALRASLPPRNLDGTPIWAETSIANITPMMGLYPVAISKSAWINTFLAQPFHTEFNLQVQPNGDLLYQGVVVGHFTEPATCVGRPVAVTAPQAISGAQLTGYVAFYAPIVEPGGATVERIVGYGFVEASAPNPSTFKLAPGIRATTGSSTSEVRVWVAANGTSAHLDSSAPALTGGQWDAVLAENKDLAYGGSQNPGGGVSYDHARLRPGTLLAPALAR